MDPPERGWYELRTGRAEPMRRFNCRLPRAGVFVLAWLLSFPFITSRARAELFDEADLSTPRRAAESFMRAAGRKDWETARAILERRGASKLDEARTNELAQRLAYLLAHSLSFDLDRISDDPKGDPEDGADTEQIARIGLQSRRVPISLRRQAAPPQRWLISSATQAEVAALYAEHGPSHLESSLPAVLRRPFWVLERWQWLGLAIACLVAVALGQLCAYLVTRILLPISARTKVLWDDELVKALRSPLRLLLGVLAFVPIAHALGLPASVRLVVIRIVTTLFIAAIAWMLIEVVGVISNLVERRAFNDDGGEPHRLRGVQTQARVLRRVLSTVLAVCAGAVVLMQFEAVRSAGVSLLASAGVAGLVLGLAAQRTLGSLFAGLQLSITQPIRIGDEVIIEGEFGTIEEITLTYVVVKVWDERRLIVPMNRFLEYPFQNWTKVSAQLHGTVMLYADFSLSIAELRRKLDELLENHPLWDRRTKAVHVTDAKERTIEVRVLVSAANGGNLFNLRADLREKLVGWLSSLEAGHHLPRTRVEGGSTPV